VPEFQGLTDLQETKLTRYFHVLDHNGDGFLEKKDILEVADNLAKIRNLEEGSSTYEEVQMEMKQIWTQVRTLADVEDESRITLDEWLAHEEKVVQSEELLRTYMQSIAETVFEILDFNDNGRISEKEYINAIEAFGASREEGKMAFEKLDADNSGHLTWDQFLEAVKQFHLSDDPEARGNWLFGPYREASAPAG